MVDARDIAVVVPTYGREAVLLNTIRQLLDQDQPPGQVIVVDQTPRHESDTDQTLRSWADEGKIDWIRSDRPSQPAALNLGIRACHQAIVLFVDDDIRINKDYIACHAKVYTDPSITGVAGRVIQPEGPNDGPATPSPWWKFKDMDFAFYSSERCIISNGMSGNLSVRKADAVRIGGFDEQFRPPVSYRFDMDFCTRLSAQGGRILFEPSALIYHLRAASGGTRSLGSHLTSASPVHGVGDYYFALGQGFRLPVILHIMRRPWREVCTRFHLRHPWWIPVKLLGETRAFLLACVLRIQGPKLLSGVSHS